MIPDLSFVEEDTPSDYSIPENKVEWGRPSEHSTMVRYSDGQIIRMDSRIESYAVYEEVRRDNAWAMGRNPNDIANELHGHMERQLRENLSFYGCIIDDSIYFRLIDRDNNTDYYTFCLSARAICPTTPPDIAQAPKRKHCQHCLTYSFEDNFHSGTCENCGAPY